MSLDIVNILLIDLPDIVLSGLKSILDRNTIFRVDQLHRMPTEEHSEYDLLIAHPDILSFHDRATLDMIFPSAKFVALICDHMPMLDIYYGFDAIINMRDSSIKLVETIEKLVADKVSDNTMIDGLTEREVEILVLVTKGMSSKMIADQYNISIHTVLTHRRNISHKIGINNVLGQLAYAISNGLLSESDILHLSGRDADND